MAALDGQHVPQASGLIHHPRATPAPRRPLTWIRVRDGPMVCAHACGGISRFGAPRGDDNERARCRSTVAGGAGTVFAQLGPGASLATADPTMRTTRGPEAIGPDDGCLHDAGSVFVGAPRQTPGLSEGRCPKPCRPRNVGTGTIWGDSEVGSMTPALQRPNQGQGRVIAGVCAGIATGLGSIARWCGLPS